MSPTMTFWSCFDQALRSYLWNWGEGCGYLPLKLGRGQLLSLRSRTMRRILRAQHVSNFLSQEQVFYNLFCYYRLWNKFGGNRLTAGNKASLPFSKKLEVRILFCEKRKFSINALHWLNFGKSPLEFILLQQTLKQVWWELSHSRLYLNWQVFTVKFLMSVVWIKNKDNHQLIVCCFGCRVSLFVVRADLRCTFCITCTLYSIFGMICTLHNLVWLFPLAAIKCP